MTDRLAVGIDVRKFRPAAGQARYVWRLGEWLATRGHRVEVITVRRQPEDVDVAPGVRLHRLHGVSAGRLAARVADLELDALLVNPERARRYRRIRPNVLRPGYGTEHYRQKLRSFRTPLGRGARALLRAAPWVLAEKRWERRFYESPGPSPEVIANSRYMRDEILDSYDVPEDHVHVVHNGVDLEEFSPEERARLRPAQREAWKIPDDAVCLLFMGHNFRLKGLWQILEHARRLRTEVGKSLGRADLRVLIAGSGVGRGQIRKAERIVERLGLDGAVHFLGPVDPPMLAFAAADVFVHLSWHDSFGFVVLEALAAGLPVITTPFAGASELVRDGASGVIVHPGRPGEVREAIRDLMDEGVREAMGRRAATDAASHSEEENFARVLDVMRTAAGRGLAPVR